MIKSALGADFLVWNFYGIIKNVQKIFLNIILMANYKIQPRVLSASDLPKPNNFFYRLFSSQRFLAILSLTFLIILLFPIAKTYTQKKLMEKEISDIQEEIAVYQKNNQELKEMIAYLESDQSLEEQARLNLNLKKPGEQVVVIDNSKNTVDSSTATTTEETVGNFAKWWNYFFVDN